MLKYNSDSEVEAVKGRKARLWHVQVEPREVIQIGGNHNGRALIQRTCAFTSWRLSQCAQPLCLLRVLCINKKGFTRHISALCLNKYLFPSVLFSYDNQACTKIVIFSVLCANKIFIWTN